MVQLLRRASTFRAKHHYLYSHIDSLLVEQSCGKLWCSDLERCELCHWHVARVEPEHPRKPCSRSEVRTATIRSYLKTVIMQVSGLIEAQSLQ